jgi:protein-tyrosine-phosphatase/DNA-binding transcriptional ArsR family regulator
MNVEQTTTYEHRAAKHAALSDVARLRIVDLLILGDLSPSDLQAKLGLRSNLLAHHLKVLQKAGIVRRIASEADKRRSYIHLIGDSLGDMGMAPTEQVHRIVFVCTANSARSQLAAALWRRSSTIPAASGGTHPADRIDPGAVAAARRHRIPLRALRPRQLRDVGAEDDLVITVCDHAHEELGDVGGLHWSIPDPVHAGSDEAFDLTIGDLSQRVTNLVPRLNAS